MQNIRISSSRFGAVEVDGESYPVGQTHRDVDDDVVKRIKAIDGVTVKAVKDSELEDDDDADDGSNPADNNEQQDSGEAGFAGSDAEPA